MPGQIWQGISPEQTPLKVGAGVWKGGSHGSYCLKTPQHVPLLGDRGRLFWEKTSQGSWKHRAATFTCSGSSLPGLPAGRPLCTWCVSAPVWGQMLSCCCAFLLTYRFSFLVYSFFHCVSQSVVFLSINKSIVNMVWLSALRWLVMNMQSFLKPQT